jgi:hypothetical protein
VSAAVAIAPAALAALDAAIEQALDSGDESQLEVRGDGEISSVVAWEGDRGRLACKRLPLFDSAARVAAYSECFTAYLAALAGAGVTVVDSAIAVHERDDGCYAVYCVQPVVDAASLAPRWFASVAADRAKLLFSALVDHITSCAGQRLGLDGQLSNWVVVGDTLRYLDVSTPLMRDEAGGERLDLGLFISSLPWALRPLVRRFMLRGILEKYYQPRGVVIDLLGNLHKERLGDLVPGFIAAANPHFDVPITAAEVRRYYRGDARTWAGLQLMRRTDRAWQRRVRRRQYPFLLPGSIDR